MITPDGGDMYPVIQEALVGLRAPRNDVGEGLRLREKDSCQHIKVGLHQRVHSGVEAALGVGPSHHICDCPAGEQGSAR